LRRQGFKKHFFFKKKKQKTFAPGDMGRGGDNAHAPKEQMLFYQPPPRALKTAI
jgi:hypothetical protein